MPQELATANLAILGLGLMGGSLAMALQGKCSEITAIDPDPATISLARKWQIADRLADKPDDLLSQADLVILAAPVRTIIALLDDLPSLHSGSPVVMDLGSTKTEIMAAMQSLPPRFDPIGGHPMCGKERASLENAEKYLFQGAQFALTPVGRTSSRAIKLAEELVAAVGARPLWLDPATHDRMVSETSHLPYLAANSLASITPLQAVPLVGSGFRSTARLAPSPSEIMMDILKTNQPNILSALRRYQKRLSDIETSLASEDWESLLDLLSQGSKQYDRLVK